MTITDELRRLDSGLNFCHHSPEYNTSPEDRLRAHLIRDLKRHFPDREDVQFGALARDLAQELTLAAADYHLDHYLHRKVA